MTKSTDIILPKLIHECIRDVGLAIFIGIALMIASVANAKSINPTLQFQSAIDHQEYNRLAQVILKKAYKGIGHPISKKFISTNGKHSKKVDGILLSPADRSLNKDYIRIPVAIVKIKVFAYAHKSQKNLPYEFGLLGNRVTIVNGMPIVEKSMMGMVVRKSTTVNHSLKTILRNQADLVLLPELLAISRGNKQLRQQVVALQPAAYEVPMYHYVSKNNQHLVELIVQSIEKMKKKQLISQVTRNYKNVISKNTEV